MSGNAPTVEGATSGDVGGGFAGGPKAPADAFANITAAGEIVCARKVRSLQSVPVDLELGVVTW